MQIGKMIIIGGTFVVLTVMGLMDQAEKRQSANDRLEAMKIESSRPKQCAESIQYGLLKPAPEGLQGYMINVWDTNEGDKRVKATMFPGSKVIIYRDAGSMYQVYNSHTNGYVGKVQFEKTWTECAKWN